MAMTMKDLLEKRARIWEEAKAFLDTHTPENGILSAEDDATYSKMEKDITDLTAAIDRQKRLQEVETTLKAPINAPILTNPGADDKTGTATDAYRKAFNSMLRRPKDGILMPDVINALQVGTASEGGYLVPEEWTSTLVEMLTEEGVIRGLATAIGTSGNINIPTASDTGTASWIAEEADYTESDPTFGNITLDAHKVVTTVKVSEELLYDEKFDLEAYLMRCFGRRIGDAEDAAFISGNGSGKPTGLLTSGTAAVTTAAADKITFDEVIDLFYSLKAPYRKRAKFVASDAAIKLLRKVKDGQGQYIWQPAVSAGMSDMIYNKEVVSSANMPTVAAGAKTLMFGDYSFYWIADRQLLSVKRLNELYAAKGQIGFQGMARVDGKLTVPEAVQILTMHA